ncbi:sodium-dependent lysophosphatidylcholine symporter 1-like isoform X7 [Apteryx rowi]|uniref:sodium-dependent lysophosphatidylcholine symporter 1-like isoform X7 n=1 Tax=Apteryx rowi TaxID=308060 RepID=UPI000E1D5795|nr:sodium-dependent lysophosphatidylcholine symporter 1-like isoform X7 [Apteryx rowi]
MGEHPTAPRLPCPSCLWELGGVMSSQRKGMCVWTGERHDSGFKLVSENPADETSKDWRLTVSQGFVSVLRPACSLVSQFQEEPGLPLCRKVCYAIGGIPYQMTGNALGFFFQIFLLDVVQLEPFHASLILFLGRAWDAVTDPAIGFLVSKSPRRKFGKLVPWIACSTPFGVLFYCMMWSILPDTTSVSLTFLWYLFTYSFFQTCMTCYHVPYSSLTMFLGGTQRDRDLATAYRMGMEVFSTLLGAGIQGQIVGSYHTHMMNSCYMLNGTLPNTSSSSLSDSLENTRKAYTFASLVLGSIYCLSCLILIFGVREQPGPLSPLGKVGLPFSSCLKMIMKHKPYTQLLCGFLFASVAFQIVQGIFAIFCTYAASLAGEFHHLVLIMLFCRLPCWRLHTQPLRHPYPTAAHGPSPNKSAAHCYNHLLHLPHQREEEETDENGDGGNRASRTAWQHRVKEALNWVSSFGKNPDLLCAVRMCFRHGKSLFPVISCFRVPKACLYPGSPPSPGRHAQVGEGVLCSPSPAASLESCLLQDLASLVFWQVLTDRGKADLCSSFGRDCNAGEEGAQTSLSAVLSNKIGCGGVT